MPQGNPIVDPFHPGPGKVFITGIQALVRLQLMQRQLDEKKGLKTAELVSGYRGSPLGAYDLQLWKASTKLKEHNVVFQPGLNEDLAATALWGAQMHRAYGDTTTDGVFGIWYGKGPGVDRTGDVFRTANVIRTSKLGGVLAIAGDDHSAQSSMYPHQTDGIFQAVSMPVIQPSDVEELMSLGLAGIALSRFCGLWVGFKVTAEVIETAATLHLSTLPEFVEPQDFALPPHGLGWDSTLAWPAQRAELERRLIEERLPAVRAWVRANRLDRGVWRTNSPRLAIVTTGKAHQDVLQALADLDLGSEELKTLGVSLYKVAVSWPLETIGLIDFIRGHERVLVFEEKRSCIELQLKDALFNEAGQFRPVIMGKMDGNGSALLPEVGEFTPAMIAQVLVAQLADRDPSLESRLVDLVRNRCASSKSGLPGRRPYFCSGCPHNTSTKVPEGSRSGGGIGCHVMALSQPELRTSTFSQMGGEGVQWVGAAPFSGIDHIFQNLGDGTYQHSGLLAIRAAVAAGTNITFKILYNDAVAMTGGQPAEGGPSPVSIARQLDAEGVRHIHLVSDDPKAWRKNNELPRGIEIVDRSELDAVQRKLRSIMGVTGIIYEQTCAAEKRRRRKKGTLSDPDLQVYINPRVCEGCGDCSKQSNCIAVEPLETPFGRKRAVNQSACNKDTSCTKGLCPSFVEVKGAKLKKPDKAQLAQLAVEMLASLPMPVVPPLAGNYNILCAGIGGTGVLTVGALLGAAAHVQGLAASVLDFTGLSPKNGSVLSQVRLARTEEEIHAVRIGAGTVDLLLAADLLVAAGEESQIRLSPHRTRGVVNLDAAPTADVIQNRDMIIEIDGLTLDLGRIDRVNQRDSSDTEELTVFNAGKRNIVLGQAKTSDEFVFGGGRYQWSPELATSYYYGGLDGIYKQHLVYLVHQLPLVAGQNLKSDLRFAHSSGEGGSNVDNDTFGALFTYKLGGHGFSVGYQHLSGRTGFAYVNGADNVLPNQVQINDFGNQEEHSWQVRYDYDFAALGVPGLTMMTRYLSGDNVDRGPGLSDGKTWERNTDLYYVIQSGLLKNFGIRLRNASTRSNFLSDMDESRLILSCSLALW
ncbi:MULTISPECIES: indolepyruvate ferredoxin oxidoreductase family protein [Pseudomonas]|uniref:Indolepyruvate ferredoxin oxidoreductase family protein n=1 Tax=Pseudomonas taiwanensis TaxID=470150 RepID=A0A7L9GAZ1_9PSED|nr:MULTISPECIES: indolepyruvate ferredoxin oxidoreductase family protein [Pseudomonas]QOJ89564.1 indolepyruvate ferredoxin oxidoreductase family protein [Pseudomonas taiwanensis]WQQ35074.1 indolepyruvate ferredoxin oxidoreductase family protein [Pseudomonas putida]